MSAYPCVARETQQFSFALAWIAGSPAYAEGRVVGTSAHKPNINASHKRKKKLIIVLLMNEFEASAWLER
jgi:hypothetical protein